MTEELFALIRTALDAADQAGYQRGRYLTSGYAGGNPDPIDHLDSAAHAHNTRAAMWAELYDVAGRMVVGETARELIAGVRTDGPGRCSAAGHHVMGTDHDVDHCPAVHGAATFAGPGR